MFSDCHYCLIIAFVGANKLILVLSYLRTPCARTNVDDNVEALPEQYAPRCSGFAGASEWCWTAGWSVVQHRVAVVDSRENQVL